MKKPTKALIAQWDRKLAKAGFVDVEQRDSEERLKAWHDSYFRCRYTPESFEAKRKYFELATNWLAEGTFETGQHKRAWKLHAQGLSYREIGKRLKLDKMVIQVMIQRCQHESGIKLRNKR